VDSTNVNFINEVRDRELSYNTFITSDLLISSNKNSWTAKRTANTEGYEVITFEQFKKYVLKEETVVEFENPCLEISLPELGRFFPKEKVVEKDYEILSFKDLHSSKILTLSPNKQHYQDGNMYLSIKNLLPNVRNWSIHSIKRLSDGEIFTVGDNIDIRNLSSKIDSFYIKNNNLMITSELSNCGDYLKNIVKRKQILFTTEDGVDIFNYSQEFYWVKKESLKLCERIVEGLDHIQFFIYEPENELYFSTKEKAEEYILMNKPCLSFSDIYDNLKIKDREFVLKFIKSKIK